MTSLPPPYFISLHPFLPPSTKQMAGIFYIACLLCRYVCVCVCVCSEHVFPLPGGTVCNFWHYPITYISLTHSIYYVVVGSETGSLFPGLLLKNTFFYENAIVVLPGPVNDQFRELLLLCSITVGKCIFLLLPHLV